MIHRLLAILGSIAFGLCRFVASILGLVGLGQLARFAAPLLVVALGLGAVLSARETAAILADRPEVTRSTLADVAAYHGEGGSIWFAFEALVDETFHAAGTQFFYLARDPVDPGTGLLVRSPRGDAFFRERVVGARLVDDPGLVADAIERIGPLPAGFSLDRARYLDEIEAGEDPDAAFQPSQLGAEPTGTDLLVTGRVVAPGRFSACALDDGCADDGPYLYLFADANGPTAIILRSPHPPASIPVSLEGLYLRDSFDLAPVLASEWFAGIEAEVPTGRALWAGQRPPITVPASWAPTIIFAALALVLLGSVVVGYPVFGRERRPEPRRTLGPGDAIDVEITGRMERDGRVLVLDRSPGAVERLTIEEVAVRMWRYGLLPRELSRRDAERRFVEEARGTVDRLVLHERDQSAVVIVQPGAGAHVEVGRLHRVIDSRPAIHLRHGESRVHLGTASAEERDRAAAEILAEIGRS
jgi:hypothetical protein